MKNNSTIVSSNFSKKELQLIKESSPNKLKKLSSLRISSRIERIEDLIQSYKEKLNQKTYTSSRLKGVKKMSPLKVLRYRMQHLQKSLKNYRRALDVTAGKRIETPEVHSSEVHSSEVHSLTAQPKMRISGRKGKKGDLLFRDRQRMETTPDNNVNPELRSR